MRRLIEQNLDAFPPRTDLPFLAAWIERESDGRHDLVSSLGEVGLFQLHPAEIEDMVGKAAKSAAIADIKSSPERSVIWGGALLQHYAEAIEPFGILPGTELYHGLLKTMHTSRPRGQAWLRHVIAALGRKPRTFDEFLTTTRKLKDGELTKVLPEQLPPLPTCSAWQLLQRRDAFRLSSDPSTIDRGGSVGMLRATQSVLDVALAQQNLDMLSGAVPDVAFPGVEFMAPIPDAIVFSGWGRPREARNGEHEGIDMAAPVGTPVFAVASGIVGKVTTGEFAGLFVTVQHANGWTSRYMHLSKALVTAGQSVRKGQVIGLVGISGTSGTTPHLHFDMLLHEDLLPLYSATYGTPRGGFGTRRAEGTAVPSEPLLPVAGYNQRTVDDARTNGIPLFLPPARPFPWPQTVVGVGLLALAIGGVYFGRDYVRRWF